MEPGNGTGRDTDTAAESTLARDQAMRWLARREYARRELLQRLRSKGFARDDAEAALDGLAEQGLQSDERFAVDYVRSRRSRGFGPQRIAAELGERGVGRELIAAYLDSGDGDWEQIARAALNKRFPDTDSAADRREQLRRERFLRYRGFTAQQVRRAMNTDD